MQRHCMHIGLEGTHRDERRWERGHTGDIGYHEIDMGVHKQVSIFPRYLSPITVTYSRTHSRRDDVCVMLTETRGSYGVQFTLIPSIRATRTITATVDFTSTDSQASVLSFSTGTAARLCIWFTE